MKAHLIIVGTLEVPDDVEDTNTYVQDHVGEAQDLQAVGAVQSMIDGYEPTGMEAVVRFVSMLNDTHGLLDMEVSANASDSLVRKH